MLWGLYSLLVYACNWLLKTIYTVTFAASEWMSRKKNSISKASLSSLQFYLPKNIKRGKPESCGTIYLNWQAGTYQYLYISVVNFLYTFRDVSSMYTVKKVSRFPVPSWDVNNQTLTGRRDKLNYSRPRRVWLVTSWLGTGKRLTFFLQCIIPWPEGGNVACPPAVPRREYPGRRRRMNRPWQCPPDPCTHRVKIRS